MFFLALSMFFSEPAPLDMPRAEAYLVSEKSEMRLEDRYNRLDLWTSQAVVGRWTDDDGRVFTLSRLDFAPPAIERGQSVTRSDYARQRVGIDKRDMKRLRMAIEALSPAELPEKGTPPRQMSRGYDDIDYWHGTNLNVVACAFLPKDSPCWFLAVWELAAEDEHGAMVKLFSEKFLEDEWPRRYPEVHPRRIAAGERELLRQDARNSVAAYENWRCTDAEEFSVLDELPDAGSFITSLTNDMARMRRRYAETVPSPINGSNVLCVARIYSDRAGYVSAAGENMSWSAAYWNPLRRELVAYLPAAGEGRLLRTVRHEAFHQYLSYALSMLSASPWFNEGYAQYFEEDDGGEWGGDVVLTPEWIDSAAALIPALVKMDYPEFYSGSDSERRFKYRLAWSIAYFIEKGARHVRFDPFRNLKRDYVATLLDSRDMHEATGAAFGGTEKFGDFVEEWKRFWKKR